MTTAHDPGASPIFDDIDTRTQILADWMLRVLQLKAVDYGFGRRLKELHDTMRNLGITGKIACAQWTLAQIRKDDPRGLLTYFALNKIMRHPGRDFDSSEFLLLARQSHPYADGRPSASDTENQRQHREKMRQKRLRENIEMAKDLRGRFVALIGNPIPIDLYTRATLFEGLSDKENLAVFLACIGHQATDWVVQAMSSAQNARLELAAGNIDTQHYTRSLHLSELYLKALQLHLQNVARTELEDTPGQRPFLVGRRNGAPSIQKAPAASLDDPDRKTKSGQKLPFTE